MCYKVICQKCGLFTWGRCGYHKDAIMKIIHDNQNANVI